MAVVLGNISPFLDLPMSPPRSIISERRARPLPSDVLLYLFKKDTHQSPHFEAVFDHKERYLNRKKWNQSKVNEVEYENSSDDENGNGNGNGVEDELGEDEGLDWEKEMRRRAQEIQDMRELEKKAEELQYEVDQEYGDGDDKSGQNEETEEEKRTRVRKELEKIQIWLAMAYEANNRHADCIALYQQLEKQHPSVSIRRQAAELRYILQAPKLKISQEEMVTIPLIGSSYDRMT
ncbi:UNVERIFIED_CONTAM: hypothetical protein Sangu_1807300 [Sesamum angustifolium]|uniref:Uncharacterized protein n=1 Tax=Sesamum angustifolium TaxID=2727405 RepID=A0AAW2MA26_9LAMI